jgi:hypothetical protein
MIPLLASLVIATSTASWGGTLGGRCPSPSTVSIRCDEYARMFRAGIYQEERAESCLADLQLCRRLQPTTSTISTSNPVPERGDSLVEILGLVGLIVLGVIGGYEVGRFRGPH